MSKQVCQSCGMPLTQDPKKGGTTSSGEKSTQYCSFCYVNGKFTDSMKDAKEMQKFCIDKLAEKKVPRILGWILTRGIPRLERWKATGP